MTRPSASGEAGGLHLLLWRHAEAEDGDDDLARPLTARGRRQARTMAAWIRAQAPAATRILVSPAVRTQQTAAALELPFTTDPRLAPGAAPAAILAASGWTGGTTHPAVLVVGHQPTLGGVAGQLLAGRGAAWSIRKGALWWLQRRQRGAGVEIVLRAAIGPEHLE